jgi:hypothetical protein
MSRSNGQYVREEPTSQPFDFVGLVAGVLFAFAGLAYLLGGHQALSGSGSLVLPALLVLLGLAGVAGSGLVRRSWFSRVPSPATTEATATDTTSPEAPSPDVTKAEPSTGPAPAEDEEPTPPEV